MNRVGKFNGAHQHGTSSNPLEQQGHRRSGLGLCEGHAGICKHKLSGKWTAQIGSGKTRKRLGYFDNIDDAVAARKLAEAAQGYHKNHGRVSSEAAATPLAIKSSDS